MNYKLWNLGASLLFYIKEKMRHPFTLFLALTSIIVSCQQPASAPVSENDLKPTFERTTFSESPQPREVDSVPLPLVQHSFFLKSYDSLKMDIRRRRIEFAQRYTVAKSDSARTAIVHLSSTFLLETLSDHVFPAWFGTSWAYEGISNVPGEGEIACGYFVSTTLRHADFKLNRYKLAQAYSHRIAEVLGDRLQRFTALEKLLSYVSKQPDDLYVVGLDNHVGFIEKRAGNIFFTHSSYWNPAKVIREEAAGSSILYHSQVYILSHILTNEKLIQQWLKGEQIENP